DITFMLNGKTFYNMIFQCKRIVLVKIMRVRHYKRNGRCLSRLEYLKNRVSRQIEEDKCGFITKARQTSRKMDTIGGIHFNRPSIHRFQMHESAHTAERFA